MTYDTTTQAAMGGARKARHEVRQSGMLRCLTGPLAWAATSLVKTAQQKFVPTRLCNCLGASNHQMKRNLTLRHSEVPITHMPKLAIAFQIEVNTARVVVSTLLAAPAPAEQRFPYLYSHEQLLTHGDWAFRATRAQCKHIRRAAI